MNPNTITLEVVRIPGYAAAVLIPQSRLEATVRNNSREISELRIKVGNCNAELARLDRPDVRLDAAEIATGKEIATAEREALEARIAFLERLNEEIPMKAAKLRESLAPGLTVEEYPFRPFTLGEEMKARAAATVLGNRGTPETDVWQLQLSLAATCLGLTTIELEAMDPEIGKTLIAEAMERSEPDPAKLDFLGALSRSFATQEP